MALGLNTEAASGEFNAIVKYDSRAGRMFRVDREQSSSGSWETENVEITDSFQAIFNLPEIEVGWALFAAGVAPSFVMVKLGEALPPKPGDTFKQTFRLNIKLGKSCGGDVREFASQAKVCIHALDALHTAYEAARDANPGKLPVVALKGSTPVVSSGKQGSSTNYMPTFEIVAWAPTPPEFGGSVGSVKGETLPKTTPATAPKKAPAPVESEF
jgi:hypothetical protein